MTGDLEGREARSPLTDRVLTVAWLPALTLLQAADVDAARYEFVTNTWGWVQEFARERWYLIAIAVIALIMLWRSLRK